MVQVKYGMGGGVFLEVSTNASGLHNDSGPALIFQTPDGARLELYFRNGKLHRDVNTGPAIDASQAGAGRVPLYFIDNVAQLHPAVARGTRSNMTGPKFNP